MIELVRREDWPERLNALIESRTFVPFGWGTQDCVTLAADCIEAMTGTDPLMSLRGRWSSQEEAAAVLAELGGLVHAVRDQFGQAVPPTMARRGDLVIVEVAGESGPVRALGICLGTFAAAPGPAGLQWPSMADALAAWRVD